MTPKYRRGRARGAGQAGAAVWFGADVLLHRPEGAPFRDRLRGRRVALLAHPASVDARLRPEWLDLFDVLLFDSRTWAFASIPFSPRSATCSRIWPAAATANCGCWTGPTRPAAAWRD